MESLYTPSLPASLITAGIVFLLAALSAAFKPSRKFNVPFVGLANGDINAAKSRYITEADVLLKEGFEKLRNTIFQVMTPDGPRLFLPRKYAEELKVHPREVASGMKALADRHLGSYTGIDHESETGLNSIKIDLNRNLGTFVSDVAEEVEHCFETQFPACEDWTPINLHDKLLRVVAQASARIFVGPSLCRNEDWLDCTTTFATDVMVGGERLKLWKPILRPISRYFIPEMRRIRGDHERAHSLLLPVLNERAKGEKKSAHYEKPNDMIQWIRDRAKKTGDTNVDSWEEANLQLLHATAAIHTTRLALIHAIYDLAARPEYVEPLREEVANVLKGTNGVLTKQSLTHLKMLDSFMKESQRHNPPSVATFQRKLLKPMILSSNFHIPANTVVQCNTNILSEAPAEWGDPLSFDGFRFYKLRQQAGSENKYQFASPTYDSMQFGLGKDACPGRFFASNQIKIILAYVLKHYDIKFEGEVGRPKNFMFEVNVLADPSKVVLFRRRS